ncbi:MAG TPA: UDP-N-acetylmuramoyl-L-alanine--D-glutamate ligase [Actinomycetota bacterium]|nr:UDP-N-acetylmuramoyl-L-alanine--D-glutamate ligase [Actinomycetota bacterium]
MSGRFEGTQALVVGAGVAGVGAARALVAEGAHVLVSEIRPEAEVPSAADLRAARIELRTGGHDPGDLDGVDLVVVGPGVPPAADVIRWAGERGVLIWGEMELGARLAHVPYVAITGTNGKTTVTSMVEACLRVAGVDAVACGNIGRSFPEAAREDREALVVEVSSFQLVTQSSLHPRVSALLNVAPDHLDWHGTFEDYAAAKARIHSRQTGTDVHVGNRDDPVAASISGQADCAVRWFRTGVPGAGEVGFDGGELVARLDVEHRLGRIEERGSGFRADAAAAAAVALSFGVEAAAAAAALAGFRPGAHRGEVVATVGGVRFVDDSKATNVHATAAAIEAAGDAVLIAGGRAKGADLTPLRDHAASLRAVVAIGEAAREVVAVFEGAVPTSIAGSIEDAVRDAYAVARPGDAVLLAPACASWDQFSGYAERGDRFAAAARSLREEVAARG